jgi:hypothetical protein
MFTSINSYPLAGGVMIVNKQMVEKRSLWAKKSRWLKPPATHEKNEKKLIIIIYGIQINRLFGRCKNNARYVIKLFKYNEQRIKFFTRRMRFTYGDTKTVIKQCNRHLSMMQFINIFNKSTENLHFYSKWVIFSGKFS